MRILVAGWHGQVARALSSRVANRSDVVAYAVGRAAQDLSGTPGIAQTLFGIAPEVIVNAAGYMNVDGAEDEPEEALHQNMAGAAQLAALAARRNLPIIHLSTAHVYSGEKQGAYSESDAAHPLNAYGRSKLESERALAEANPRHVILRTAWIYSPFGQNFVKSILERAARDSEIPLVDDQYGSPTYALHLADAILQICKQITTSPSEEYWGIYHAAGSGTASWHDIAEFVFKTSSALGGPSATARPISHSSYQTRSRRPENSRLDCAKLESVFGVEFPDWHLGVDDCLRHLLEARPC
ncbi:MAG: dTDP-4-dehydrorhamnose reductase [Hyphomicrobiaceae bacterium]